MAARDDLRAARERANLGERFYDLAYRLDRIEAEYAVHGPKGTRQSAMTKRDVDRADAAARRALRAVQRALMLLETAEKASRVGY